LFVGYLIGGAVMVIGGLVETAIGVNAEQRSLEDIAQPIGATSAHRSS
jgi:hypothetical protein